MIEQTIRRPIFICTTIEHNLMNIQLPISACYNINAAPVQQIIQKQRELQKIVLEQPSVILFQCNAKTVFLVASLLKYE